MLKKQFIGKLTWIALASVAVTHLLAIFIRDTGFELPAIILIFAIVAFLSWKKLEYGLFAAFLEIIIGGHGHLLDAELFGFSISLRMAIFGAVMLVWLIRWMKSDTKPEFLAFRDTPWLMLAIAITLGAVIGFLRNDPGSAFDDMNGFLTIGYLLPLISIKWDQKNKRQLLQILSAGVIWLVFFTLLLSYLFTHLDGKSLNEVYRFVRDSRLAEVTLQTVSDSEGAIVNPQAEKLFSADGYWYRIFMQSHFYVMSFILLIFSAILFLWRSQKLPIAIGLSFAALTSILFISTSRSFLLALVFGGLLLVVLSATHGKKAVLSTMSRSIATMVFLIVSVGIAWVTIVFPLPPQPDITDAAFYETSADADRELAISSRWQLLGPMMYEIYKNPILGSGFGREVSFTSDDPRVRAIDPDGLWTTYRFEWGFQDIWLKMGILGLLAFGWYAATIIVATKYTAKKHGHKWLIFGLSAGILALFVANVFSPYLNHPIGLGFMLFVLPFYDFKGLQQKLQQTKKEKKRLKLAPKLKPAMSEMEE